MLAAVLAAVMSTISSQLIVSSSALVEDLYKAFMKKDATDKHYVFLGRMAVLAVSLIAMVLAWPNNESILNIVSFAWAGFGAAFGPIIFYPFTGASLQQKAHYGEWLLVQLRL